MHITFLEINSQNKDMPQIMFFLLQNHCFQDTAGSERYEAMSRIYYRGARGAIVCYDLTDKTSYERAKFWVNELKNNEEVNI